MGASCRASWGPNGVLVVPGVYVCLVCLVICVLCACVYGVLYLLTCAFFGLCDSSARCDRFLWPLEEPQASGIHHNADVNSKAFLNFFCCCGTAHTHAHTHTLQVVASFPALV